MVMENIDNEELFQEDFYSLVYNLMLNESIKIVNIPYMEKMKEHYIEKEEFEKCQNIKNFIEVVNAQ